MTVMNKWLRPKMIMESGSRESRLMTLGVCSGGRQWLAWRVMTMLGTGLVAAEVSPRLEIWPN